MVKITFTLRRLLERKMEKRDGVWHGALVALFYGVISTAMAFINKAVLSTYKFYFPFFILALQMLLTCATLELLCWRRIISIPSYTLKAARNFFWPSLFCGLHGALSLYALHGLNIPMYGALKRCTPLVNLVLSVVMLNMSRPSLLLVTSIIVITAGCFVAALGDLTYDPYAYTLCMLSVMAQGLYQSLVQYHSTKHSLTSLNILQLNSYNTLMPFVVMSLFLEDINKIVNMECWHDPMFILVLSLVLVAGGLLNYALFLCTTVNSALTTSLVGVGKSTIQTFIGFFTFGGVKYHPLNVTGIIVNIVGGFMYAYAKLRDKKTTQPLPLSVTNKLMQDQNLNHVISHDMNHEKTSPIESDRNSHDNSTSHTTIHTTHDIHDRKYSMPHDRAYDTSRLTDADGDGSGGGGGSTNTNNITDLMSIKTS